MASIKTIEQQAAATAKKAERERDATKAMREYQAESARIDANMARLRAMRLEKEARDAQSQAVAKPAAKKTAPGAAKPARVRRARTSA
jgi:hypothetical protein